MPDDLIHATASLADSLRRVILALQTCDEALVDEAAAKLADADRHLLRAVEAKGKSEEA